MKEFTFKKIDAFATKNSDGNPAGYIWLNLQSDISATEMQLIARELKGFVSEVGYINQLSDHLFNLKYYSSEREVDFCGHATVAIMYDLIKNNAELQKLDILQIKTNRGILNVENRIKNEDAVFIMSPEPVEKETLPNTRDIADNLKINFNEIDPRFPITIINAGLSTLIVPIKSLDSILAISPDLEILKSFCFKSGIDTIEVFTTEVASKTNHFRARVFAPTFGYIEDPATGSGNSAFGYYLIKHNLWNGDTISIEQNGLRDRFNIVKLQRQIDDKGNDRVLFGGGAITRIEGKYIIH
jgi:PhzF family phenazine biosynthesis protein